MFKLADKLRILIERVLFKVIVHPRKYDRCVK